MIKFIQRFFDPSEKFDDESLIDLILELEDRVEYLERENDSLYASLTELEDRLDQRIDRIQPVIYHINGGEKMYDDLDGFEKALSFFGNRVEIICAMELGGRITAEDAYQLIKEELKGLKKVRKKVKNDSEYGYEWTPLVNRD